MKKNSAALPSNGTNTRLLGSGTRKTSPTVPKGVIWTGPNADRNILVGAISTPRCNLDGKSMAGKLLPRKCPERSLVPTKTICSRCMQLDLLRTITLAHNGYSSRRVFGQNVIDIPPTVKNNWPLQHACNHCAAWISPLLNRNV